ncbi:MAG TPA: DUF6285 domain-containing protein [Stellaceae bacterium]|nr:DUF6285 domain-containing protein [Stellaceae bacterium]
MRDPPDIDTLLELAAAGGDAELTSRCRAIAARERANGMAPYEALGAELRALPGGGDRAPDLAALTAAIVDGQFDAAPERERLVRFLWRLALQKLRENNPGFERKKI